MAVGEQIGLRLPGWLMSTWPLVLGYNTGSARVSQLPVLLGLYKVIKHGMVPALVCLRFFSSRPPLAVHMTTTTRVFDLAQSNSDR